MYIVQMADLHIGSEKVTSPKEEELIVDAAKLIKERIPVGEQILVCLCGDNIDSKGLNDASKDKVQERYEEAGRLMGLLKNNLEDDYPFFVKCCSGNHDITHMEEFHGFVKSLDDEWPSQKCLKSSYAFEKRGQNVCFVMVNSCDGDQYEEGRINYKELEKQLNKLGHSKKKVLVLHHTIMSMFEDDRSSIRNAAKLVHLIEKYNIVGILHGHIHGREILRLGNNQCKVIGTGALFTRDNSNVNSQFNIIQMQNGNFVEILNCRYNADCGENPWDVKNLCEENLNNIFKVRSFSEGYTQILNHLNQETPLCNGRMEIESDYDDFVKDLAEFLKDDVLKIGENTYNYFQLGEMWQAEKVPDELYFNHGSYFVVDGKNGVDFVAEQMKKKPTSNRIELPTYNMEELVNSLDDSVYLPSVKSIQFGKVDDKVIVHMHLRALEARRFLKINICEVDYLLKQLKNKGIEFRKVRIVLEAFRIQARDRFNCFLKAKIDEMPVPDLSAKVFYGKIDELCRLLQEKRDGMETITKLHGIKAMYDAMVSYNREGESSASFFYKEDVLGLFEQVLKVYEALDEMHKTTSVQSEEEKKCEKKIDELLGKLIAELKKLENVKRR